jgi:para-aminobenzoate synthetase component I
MSLLYKTLPYIKPQKIFNIVAEKFATVFLDSRLQHDYYGRYSFIGIDPVLTISPDENLSLQQQLQQFEELKTSSEEANLPPFTGGLMGYLSYDYAGLLEPSVKHDNPGQELIPDYWFGLYNQVFAFDNLEQVCYLLVTELPNIDSITSVIPADTRVWETKSYNNKETCCFSGELLSKLQEIYDNASNMPSTPIIPPNNIVLGANFTKEEYIAAVEKTIEYIKSGDIFEANISQCFRAKINDKQIPSELYKYLQLKNPAPFAAYLNLDKLHILSASPERFIQVRENNVETRPIKGTIRRDNDLQIDNLLAQTLQTSAKDRAENIMIVDLMRNDLSKICTAKSVVVNQLCGLESFTNVHHLVSVINGELKPYITTFDIIQAVFPAGSISGAPKIRAQQIITELEQNMPRGISYGNIGYMSFNGNIDLSVAIRTLTIYNNELSFHIGGAVTLYSDPLAEYEETMLKGQKLFESLNS